MLSLVLPTYNEAENIRHLLPRLREILKGLPFEVIVVDDDSPDRTWEVAAEFGKFDEHFRVIRRIGRRGLSSAVVEGFAAAKGDVFAVADADGQHDLTLLPRLYAAAQSGAGVAVGSRYAEGGSMGEWDERRQFLSRIATRLVVRLCKVRVSDPMSGFFAVRRETFEAVAPSLNPRGFKILMDILLRISPKTRVVELPFSFGVRTAGKSKLSLRVQGAFLVSLLEASLGRWLPWAFMTLCLLIVLVLAPRLWALRHLYLRTSVRRDAQESLQRIADTKGWLLSDLDLRTADTSSMEFLYREHRKNASPPHCFQYSFSAQTLNTCDE